MTRVLTLVLGLFVALVGFVPAGAADAAGPHVDRAAAQPQRIIPASASSCVASAGVYVIVITGDGSIIAQGCTTRPRDGKAALDAVATVIEREQGFVCQINNVPNRCAASSEWTTNTPMWRYSYATPGGSWIYSNWGYTGRTPPAGSLEAWCLSPGPCESKLAGVLNPGSVPGYAPVPSIAPTTAPTKAPTSAKPPTKAPTTAPTTKRATTTKAPTTTQVATSAATSAATQPSASASSMASASPSAVSSTPASTAPASTATTPDATDSPSVTTASATTEASPTTVVAEPPAGGGGTPWGAITTVGLIAAAAATFGIVRIRRGKANIEPIES